jgi:hypothetical protein
MTDNAKTKEARAFELLDRIDVQSKAYGRPVGGIEEMKHIITALSQQPAAVDVEKLVSKMANDVYRHLDRQAAPSAWLILAFEAVEKHFPRNAFAQPQWDGWQPIETAPKDGTVIIARNRVYDVQETWWFRPSSRTENWLKRGGKVFHPVDWLCISPKGRALPAAPQPAKGDK